MSAQPIIPPVEKALLKAELTPETLLRQTNRAGNELYVVGPEAVNVIRENDFAFLPVLNVGFDLWTDPKF